MSSYNKQINKQKTLKKPLTKTGKPGEDMYNASVPMPLSTYKKLAKYARKYSERSFAAQMRVLAEKYVEKCERKESV